jgi:hypothetical protein
MDTNIHAIIKHQDQLLRKVARMHNQDNPGHCCLVYNNFVNCDCGYHAHAAGSHADYLIHHDGQYAVYEHVL